MRNKEQFKAYVYEKADAARISKKRMYTAWVRGSVAFSLLVIVCGAFVQANGGWLVENDRAFAPAAEKSADMETYCLSGNSGEMMQVVLEDAGAVKNEASLEYSTLYAGTVDSHVYFCYTSESQIHSECCIREWDIATEAKTYSGDLTSIDFSKHAALVVVPTAKITGWDILYGNTAVEITFFCSAEEADADTYTVLLDKNKYFGQKIEFICE